MNQYSEIKLIPLLFGVGKLNISDTVFFFTHFAHHWQRDDIIIWTDTVMSWNNLPRLGNDFKGKVYTTSRWNVKVHQSLGVHVDDVIPRPVNEDVANKYVNEKKEFFGIMMGSNPSVPLLQFSYKIGEKITVAVPSRYPVLYEGKPYQGDEIIITRDEKTHDNILYIDRKGVHYVLRLKNRKDVKIIANHPQADLKPMSLDEDEKYRLLASSRWYLAFSHSEGFGLPPVEAMSVGTPSIYFNCHGFREWLVGIPIECEEERDIQTPLGTFHFWYASQREIDYHVKEALEISPSAYEDLRQKCLEKSKQFYAREVLKKLGLPIKS